MPTGGRQKTLRRSSLQPPSDSTLHAARRSRSQQKRLHIRRTCDPAPGPRQLESLSMTTKLARALKRELLIGRQPYTLTVSPTGLALVVKGRRKGLELMWADVVSGDAALATALNASLKANLQPQITRPKRNEA